MKRTSEIQSNPHASTFSDGVLLLLLSLQRREFPILPLPEIPKSENLVDPLFRNPLLYVKERGIMVLEGILGFQGAVYLLLLLGFLVIRQVWKNAEAKKEEIVRLREDTAMAEMEIASAAAAYGGGAVDDVADVSFSDGLNLNPESVSQWYQCALCYSPTTMRCSRCKAVRYWFVSFFSSIFFD